MTTYVSWFPLLFITIACSAISGFHGLVSLGTSSKQLNNEKDARFVGYFGAVGEGVLALISILAVVTLFASEADFLATYSSFTEANGEGLSVFIEGAANLANGLIDRKSTRLNSSHVAISYAVFCLKKK